MVKKDNVVQLPNTKTMHFGDLTLQLRLDGKSILNIEKRLDEGIMGLFVKKQGEVKLPPVNSLLIVLQGANKTSGVTDKAIVDAFEKYIESGKTTMDLFGEINEFLDEQGFFGKKEQDSAATDGESLDQAPAQEDSLL